MFCILTPSAIRLLVSNNDISHRSHSGVGKFARWFATLCVASVVWNFSFKRYPREPTTHKMSRNSNINRSNLIIYSNINTNSILVSAGWRRLRTPAASASMTQSWRRLPFWSRLFPVQIAITSSSWVSTDPF